MQFRQRLSSTTGIEVVRFPPGRRYTVASSSARPISHRYSCMLRRKARAGVYAEDRYRRGLRSWQAKNRRLFAVWLGPIILAGLAVVTFDRDLVAWTAGLAAGAAIAFWIVLWETPPRYVEQWRDGAEGERQAERALGPLEKAGWQIVHDVQNGRGNYDHIAVGPGGVYLLDSKNLQGIVRIERGVPRLTRRHDPEKREVFDHLPRAALAAAAQLKDEIQEQTGRSVWVRAVVVFWSEFPEGFVQVGKCVFIEGSQLRRWLEGQPHKLSEAEIAEVGAGVDVIAGNTSNSARHRLRRQADETPARRSLHTAGHR
jgi:Nuclease-related domain